MLNNNSFNPYYTNYQPAPGYKIIPVARIEEANTIFPDLQGNPLFFYDKERNEFFIKQRNVQTSEVQMLRYTFTAEPLQPLKTQEAVKNYDEDISLIKSELERIQSVLCVKSKKAVKDDE